MLRSYLRTGWRNLAKNSTYSIIIISGLVLAYSACLAIFLFIENETSYDRQSPDSERIYRIVHNNVDDNGTIVPDATTPVALAPYLLKDISQIESITRLRPTWGIKALVTSGTKSFFEQRLVGADSSMINFFGLKIVAGDPNLNGPQAIAVTETIAKKYFGKTDVVGQTLMIDPNTNPFVIKAVIEDMPANSHFHFDIILALWQPLDKEEIWDTYNYYTYIKIKDGVDISSVDPQIQQAFEKYRPGRNDQFYAQAITDIHLRSKLKWEIESNGDQSFVTIFLTIGIFIFLIASVNYINLSIVQALNRSKEVGIRKVSGALGRELIDQFLLESTLISIVSMLVAIGLMQAIVPFINAVFNQNLRTLLDLPFYYLIIVIVLSIIAGILSGLYPALYLSAFRPAAVLKGVFQPGSKNAWLRKSLVVLQFAISIALITGAIVVFKQVDYLRSKDLGFNKDQVIVVQNITELKNKAQLKEAFRNVQGVQAVSGSNGTLGGSYSTQTVAAKGILISAQVNYAMVDEDYLNTTGVQLIAGRLFNASDLAAPNASKVILNEKAVYDLGLSLEEAIGAQITPNHYADSVVYLEVVGVVKDFHFTSLKSYIMPYGFFLDTSYITTFSIKVNSTDYDRLLADLKNVWTSAGTPGQFEYFFLDQQFDNLYRAEENFQFIFTIFTAISIYIACSGLFAIASYFIKRRKKEIGIRKALGASVSQVTLLVSSGFIRMVIIANLLAWPVTWLFMNDWLNGFAYKIEMNWIIFLVSGILALLIAVFTIGGQSIKAAQANPIESLRNE